MNHLIEPLPRRILRGALLLTLGLMAAMTFARYVYWSIGPQGPVDSITRFSYDNEWIWEDCMPCGDCSQPNCRVTFEQESKWQKHIHLYPEGRFARCKRCQTPEEDKNFWIRISEAIGELKHQSRRADERVCSKT